MGVRARTVRYRKMFTDRKDCNARCTRARPIVAARAGSRRPLPCALSRGRDAPLVSYIREKWAERRLAYDVGEVRHAKNKLPRVNS